MPAPAQHDTFIGQVAVVCGLNVAHRLIEAYGGTYRHFARDPTPECQVSIVIGVRAAQRIAREVGHGQQWVPQRHLALSAINRAARREGVKKLRCDGLSHQKIARRLGVGVRTVERDLIWLRAQAPLK